MTKCNAILNLFRDSNEPIPPALVDFLRHLPKEELEGIKVEVVSDTDYQSISIFTNTNRFLSLVPKEREGINTTKTLVPYAW